MRKQIALTTIAVLMLTSCQQQEVSLDTDARNQILASIDNLAASRTVVDDETGAQSGAIGIMWTDDDQIGVFDNTGTAQKQYNKVETGATKTSAFAVESGQTAFSNPKYAYYPYDGNNNGKGVDQLTGTVPTSQSMDAGTLQGDYKFGNVTSSSDKGHLFEFKHLFSLARFTVDASSTPIADQRMRSLTISAKRGDSNVAIAGGFTFSAKSGEWQQSGNGSNAITLSWGDNFAPALLSSVQCYMSLFPTIQVGDVLTITIETTDGFKAELTATSKVNFAQETVYNFPLTLANYSNAIYTDAEGKNYGSFTCAAMNVDGLPSISIGSIGLNPDGPGKEGTASLGNIANGLGWSFFAVSENFEYNTQLSGALTNYNAGMYRGSIDITQLYKQADTDGLGFFWKKNGVTATNETIVEFTTKKGDITHGANESIKKGFRWYEVTVAPEVVVDVYITHMNTYEGSGNTPETNDWVKAQIAQLVQMRDYVTEKANKNNRPAIIMGDTNMRYTRHQIGDNLIIPVSNMGLTIVDPWVKCNRNNVYPTWNTKSLMIRSKFAGDTTNDIVCSDDQRGEVVDKMWYINVPGASVQLEALSCENDVTNFTKSTESASYNGVQMEDENGNISTGNVNYTRNIGYADHFPVVTTFKWTRTK